MLTKINSKTEVLPMLPTADYAFVLNERTYLPAEGELNVPNDFFSEIVAVARGGQYVLVQTNLESLDAGRSQMIELEGEQGRNIPSDKPFTRAIPKEFAEQHGLTIIKVIDECLILRGRREGNANNTGLMVYEYWVAFGTFTETNQRNREQGIAGTGEGEDRIDILSYVMAPLLQFDPSVLEG